MNERKLPIARSNVEDIIIGMLDNLEGLPPYAMAASLTHYDYKALLWVMLAIVRIPTDDDCINPDPDFDPAA